VPRHNDARSLHKNRKFAVKYGEFAGWSGENAEKDPRKPFKMAESRHFSAIFRILLS
jgi:hypothetical protein